MLEDKTPRPSKQLQLYQGVQLPTIEVQVLEHHEEGIGKPIPPTGKIFGNLLGFKVEENHVVELGLSSRGLETLPEPIGKLRNLRVLRLQKNKLTILPESFEALLNLRSLD